MKTTIEIPDELFHEAEAKAVLQGIHLRDLVIQGLQLVLQSESTQPKGTAFPLIRGKDRSRQLTDDQVVRSLAESDEEYLGSYASFMRH